MSFNHGDATYAGPMSTGTPPTKSGRCFVPDPKRGPTVNQISGMGTF